MELSEHVLRKIEHMYTYFSQHTGDAIRDEYYSYILPILSSPDSSGIQEILLAQACGAEHKGNKKHGDDASLPDMPLELKPCKSTRSVSCVNITDDQPSRLKKDLETPNKHVVIGRCPGGIQFKWVVACPLSDFAESRYRGMCSNWKHEPEEWPTTVEDQIRVVERLAEKRTKNTYKRTSTLKFTDIRNVTAFWVHPDIDKTKLTRKAEDDIIRRFCDK